MFTPFLPSVDVTLLSSPGWFLATQMISFNEDRPCAGPRGGFLCLLGSEGPRSVPCYDATTRPYRRGRPKMRRDRDPCWWPSRWAERACAPSPGVMTRGARAHRFVTVEFMREAWNRGPVVRGGSL